MQAANRLRAALLVCLLGLTSGTQAENVRIVTWNVRDCFSVADVQARSSDFSDFFTQVDPDIILIQEVTSEAVVQQIATEMGFPAGQFHVAISDFVTSDGPNRNSFEVAIISRFPLAEIAEFDPIPDAPTSKTAELSIDPVTGVGVESVGTSRGFLRVDVPDLKLSLVVVHLKSSVGRVGSSDSSNAKKRELVAAAIAMHVAEQAQANPTTGQLVAGDFNVGCADTTKNGVDLSSDCFSGNNCDLYDDTHALLHAGIVPGVEMENLVLPLAATPTFPSFGGTPIDNIYVSGALADRFSGTEIVLDTFGSDHRPVLTILETGVDPSALKQQLLERIEALEAELAELRTLVEQID